MLSVLIVVSGILPFLILALINTVKYVYCKIQYSELSNTMNAYVECNKISP